MDNLKQIIKAEIELIKKFKKYAINRQLFRTAKKFDNYINAYNEVLTTFIPKVEGEK
jgi:hypothetical protein